MPRYVVEVARQVDQVAWISVDADSDEQARALAENEARDNDPDWVNDIVSGPYWQNAWPECPNCFLPINPASGDVNFCECGEKK